MESKKKKTFYCNTELAIGAEILCRAALSEDFEGASGKYYDNDHERFAFLHPFASH